VINIACGRGLLKVRTALGLFPMKRGRQIFLGQPSVDDWIVEPLGPPN
jgi:hypothetical protein